ncbi:MAG: hypothetical protein ACOYLB_07990 [Phototrophicaceae bacterium]
MNEDDLEYEDIDDDDDDDETGGDQDEGDDDLFGKRDKKPFQGFLKPKGGDQPGSGQLRSPFSSIGSSSTIENKPTGFGASRSSSSPFGARPKPVNSDGDRPSPFGSRPPHPPLGGSASPFGSRPKPANSDGDRPSSFGVNPFSKSASPFGSRPSQSQGKDDASSKGRNGEEVGAFGRGFGASTPDQPKRASAPLFGNLSSSTHEKNRNASSTSKFDPFSILLSLVGSRHIPTPEEERASAQLTRAILGVCVLALSSCILGVSWYMQDQTIGRWLASASQFLATWGNIIIPAIGVWIGLKLIFEQPKDE